MAEQAQKKLDETQKPFNQNQGAGASQTGPPAVEYDKHGGPIPTEAAGHAGGWSRRTRAAPPPAPRLTPCPLRRPVRTTRRPRPPTHSLRLGLPRRPGAAHAPRSAAAPAAPPATSRPRPTATARRRQDELGDPLAG